MAATPPATLQASAWATPSPGGRSSRSAFRRRVSAQWSVDPVRAGWALCIALVGTGFVTYWRLPAGAFFGVTGDGVTLAGSRVVTLVGYPIALLAPLLGIAAWATSRTRRSGVALALGTVLCATATIPGVLSADRLNARPVNLLALVGVLVCLAVTATTGRAGRRLVRVPAGAAIALASLLVCLTAPWLLAQLGVYVGDVPLLRAVYMSKQVMPEPGYPTMHAVHLGNHEGLDGALLLLVSALVLPLLRRLPHGSLRGTLVGYGSLLAWYGAAVLAGDLWHEQVVKRGWYPTQIPNTLQPGLNTTWLLIILATATTTYAILHERSSDQRSALITP